MRISLRSLLVSAGLVAATGAVAGAAFAGGPTVHVVLLREHGVGTSTQVQPYLNQFISGAAQINGWDPASSGEYTTTRAAADGYIKANDPHYGIFSLPAFLALRKQYNLDVVGSATLSVPGGVQYFIVSLNQGSLADCKGKQLATDHAGDPAFIEKVVANGAFTLSDFTVVTTRRFSQAGSSVLNGNAECALIDDAQYADFKKDPKAASAKVAWQSATLPPMPVVAFPSAPAAEKAAFAQNLSKICPANQQTCQSVGLQTLTSATSAAYQSVIGKYP